MFTAALFTITKRRKQPQCPPADEWINKMWYTYNGTLFSLKKEGNPFAYYNMDEFSGYYAISEARHRKRNII